MAEPRKPRVLLADDETHIRILMKTIMASMNCEIVGEAKNGEEAVELFKKTNPDIVLLDINMPLKTGEEALADIMKINPGTLVIMLTSVSDMDCVKQCIMSGASNYIRKDTPLPEIRQKITETFRKFIEKKGASNV